MASLENVNKAHPAIKSAINQPRIAALRNRLIAEWRLGMFSLEDTEGNTLDLEKTFKPEPKFAFLFIKMFFLLWIVSVNCLTIVRSESPGFWPALLGNWTATGVTLYFLASLSVMTIVPISQTEGTKIWIRMTWVLYTLTLNLGLIVTFLFWFLENDGGAVTYVNVMQHGIFFLFVLIDGMLINRIPIRLKQLLCLEAIGGLYLIWTIIHAVTSVGNPLSNSGNPDNDDDALYDVVNWKLRAGIAVILSIILAIFAVPILYLFLWVLSLLFKPRHYVTVEHHGRRDNDVEQGEESTFA
jgi:hypothetical protein